jgi:hypothetical protein
MSASDDQIPVFEYAPRSDTLLGECIGWVGDEAQACDLLLKSDAVMQDADIEIPGMGKTVFGGVIKGQIRLATDDGPNRDATGLYRWQACFYPFFDSIENAGKPSPLDNIFIYNG